MINNMKKMTLNFTTLIITLLMSISVMGRSSEPVFTPGKDTCEQEIPGSLTLLSSHESSQRIVLRWYLTSTDYMDHIVVMRKEAGKNEFVETNVKPGYSMRNDSLIVVVNDITIEPYKWYSYYLQPYNFCEEKGATSDTIGAKSAAANELPFAKSIIITPLPAERSLKLDWEMSGEIPVKATYLYRSKNSDGPFQNIAALPAGTNSFVDIVPLANENFFYYMVAETYFGIGVHSATVFGSFTGEDVPMPPQGLVVLPSDSGVLVSWDLDESFILGYHVFRKNGNEDTFRDISGRLSPETQPVVFMDKDTLTPLRTYEYHVIAISDGFLESEPSNSVSIRMEEGVVPPPSQLKMIQAFENKRLLWSDLSETYPWVKEYVVWLFYSDESIDTMFVTVPRNYLDFSDEKELLYADVSAISFLGNQSVAARYNPQKTTLPTPANVRILDQPQGVQIAWDEIMGWKLQEYLIYRESENMEHHKIATVPFGTNKYTDTTAVSGRVYGYSVSLKDKHSNESPISGIVVIHHR